jgi:hypothetical protein
MTTKRRAAAGAASLRSTTSARPCGGWGCSTTPTRSTRYAAFYNDVVSNEISLAQDFQRWLLSRRTGRPGFSFCAHPFVLDAGAKAAVLGLDAEVQQAEQARAAMLSALLGGGEVSPYFSLRVRRDALIEDALQGELDWRPQVVMHGGEERRASGIIARLLPFTSSTTSPSPSFATLSFHSARVQASPPCPTGAC